MENIVENLFPIYFVGTRESHAESMENTPLLNQEELSTATDSLQSRKAPGPDGIPAEVLTVIAHACPQLLFNMYNRCLDEYVFHRR